jgi:glycosyltransferase involved in cell wall biosynthesis
VRRLVFITQQVDLGHPALAATVPMISALARRVDEVVVLADGAVPGSLPENCRVEIFAAPARVLRGLRFETVIARELVRRPVPIAMLAHMCPIYAVLAAPLARPARVPVLLWFTHWRASRLLQLAERVSSSVLSVDRSSFPLPSSKVRELGHGIDVAAFPCHEPPGNDPLHALALGRYSPTKGYETLIRAARRTGVRLTVHGPALTEEERRHREELRSLAGADAELRDAVPRTEIPALLARADVLLNNNRTGTADKVVYEACASCVPAFASAASFVSLLPEALRFAREDDEGLAEALTAFAARSREERLQLGKDLRGEVERGHSVESWADGVLAAAR